MTIGRSLNQLPFSVLLHENLSLLYSIATVKSKLTTALVLREGANISD